MKLLGFLVMALTTIGLESRQIEFTNKCGYNIWVNPRTNAPGAPLAGGIAKIQNGGRFTYQIPNNGWYVKHRVENASGLIYFSYTGLVVSGLNSVVITMELTANSDRASPLALETVAIRRQIPKSNSSSLQLATRIRLRTTMSAW